MRVKINAECTVLASGLWRSLENYPTSLQHPESALKIKKTTTSKFNERVLFSMFYADMCQHFRSSPLAAVQGLTLCKIIYIVSEEAMGTFYNNDTAFQQCFTTG